MKPYAILALVCLGAIGQTEQSSFKDSRYLTTFLGQSLLVLGSEDRRVGGGLGFGYGRPEPKFRWKNIPAELVWSGYTDRTTSNGSRDVHGINTYAYGILATSRWRPKPSWNGWGTYFDFGWGIQYANRTSHDLDSKWNSTPLIGAGVRSRYGENGEEFTFGVSWFHISNAGFVKPNRGQNQICLVAGIRY